MLSLFATLVYQVRLQANIEKAATTEGGARPTFIGALREVVQHEGAEGLFRGWSGQITKSALGSAIAATSKEKIAGMIPSGMIIQMNH